MWALSVGHDPDRIGRDLIWPHPTRPELGSGRA